MHRLSHFLTVRTLMGWSKRSKTGGERADARCRKENYGKHSGSKSFFTRCTKNRATTKNDSFNLNDNEFDYIVEKLVVKRIPVGLFATSNDVYENTERDDLPRSNYSIVRPLNSSIIYTSTNEPGVSGFGSIRRGTSKNVLHMTNNNDATYEREDNPVARSLDRFTALHPNLKESERPPKDPLNMTKSRRSLAEALSEIAAKKEIPNASDYERRNEILTTGRVHTASESLQNSNTDKNATEEKSSSNREKSVNSSCFPFGWKTTDNRSPDENNSDENEESFVGGKNKNFTIAPIQVHYRAASLNSENIKNIKQADGRCNILTMDRDSQVVCKESEPKNDDLTGTMLRWKIIIKHRPPTSTGETSNTRSESVASKIPQLHKSLRNPIEANVYKESRKIKNKMVSL